MGDKLNWRGDDVEKTAQGILADTLSEAGLRVEGAAKKRLYKGHGVVTGTLRRSIHCAPVGYNWRGDNTVPSAMSPELGGREAVPTIVGLLYRKLVIEIGSGLNYAMPVHQGHHSFTGYHFISEALDEIRPQVPDILRRQKRLRGLRV